MGTRQLPNFKVKFAYPEFHQKRPSTPAQAGTFQERLGGGGGGWRVYVESAAAMGGETF